MKAYTLLEESGFEHINSTALSERDWWGVIAVAGAPDRYWECFDVLQPFMSDDEYAQTVREIWVATKGLRREEARSRLLGHGRKITQEMWMRHEDAVRFRRLGEEFVVYRGCAAGTEEGWSWTLDRDVAEHFAAQVEGDPMILTGSVLKDDVIAVFSGEAWAEAEVVVPGDRVRIGSIDRADV